MVILNSPSNKSIDKTNLKKILISSIDKFWAPIGLGTDSYFLELEKNANTKC